MQDLRGKVAVVTGAGSGLGRELALACSRRSMSLVLADISAADLARTEGEILERLPSTAVLTLRTDVTDWAQVDELAYATCRRFGGAHLLFNNAGVGVSAPVWESSPQDWSWVINVNLFGVAFGVRAFVPIMLRQGEGHVINVASAAGWVYPAGSGVYNASKAAVVALSETLANDLAQKGGKVGVSVLSPAFFKSHLVDCDRNRPMDLGPSTDSELGRIYQDKVRRAMQLGRISATQIAESTLEAVIDNRFYVFPHDWVQDAIVARSKAAKLGRTAFHPKDA